MILLFIIGVVVLGLGAITFINDEESTRGFLFIIIGVLIMLSVLSEMSEPSAMDVYEGKTTLEITYRDNVPVDSIVVFKK